MRSYTLDAKDKNSNYTIEERLRNRAARGDIMYRNSLEELDNLTAKFTSFEDLSKEFQEIYNSKIETCDPIIIVDQDNDLSKSYYIKDVVYEEDKKVLDNPDYIRCWLFDYLKRNPEDILKFRGIKDIYLKLYGDRVADNYIVENVIHAYFSKPSYKRYRDIYFKLKELDQGRVNGIHK